MIFRLLAFSLAYLEIRSRNEEVINKLYTKQDLPAKGFYFLLYRCRYLLFVSEIIDLVCVLVTTRNMSVVVGYTRVYKKKIQEP